MDIDTELPVYCPLEVTVAETDYYDETNYCEVTPCLLPERSVVCMVDSIYAYLLVKQCPKQTLNFKHVHHMFII